MPGDEQGSADRASLVGHVEVICEAVLGAGTLTLDTLLKLKPGDTVPLDSSPADPVHIRVNGKTIALGEIVMLDDRFAIRLTDVG